jgi:hypothetical protein
MEKERKGKGCGEKQKRGRQMGALGEARNGKREKKRRESSRKTRKWKHRQLLLIEINSNEGIDATTSWKVLKLKTRIQ